MFKIEETSQNEIKITGEFDASQAEIVTDFLEKYNVTITLNFEELSYISSTLIRELIIHKGEYKKYLPEGIQIN